MLRFIYFIMCFYIFIRIDLFEYVLSNIVFIVINSALIVLCSLKVKFFLFKGLKSQCLGCIE